MNYYHNILSHFHSWKLFNIDITKYIINPPPINNCLKITDYLTHQIEEQIITICSLVL